ncbi:beta-lactamase/transpeptidase-like protein [Gloeophyllum trabeum ATCC 11539]|uniref:Beta-lactamase/transpeptidase-like protein n=1 Tax=Gloeophyllum trabeum (strain ATCC 11539 / FP-39264 / Madison 617) TaxID=670483 RepID=S7RQ79_GLOTA|nr:beta-lactamase/transpeptidase-like protein [Gloeophyllum trabeum ATCC 11539]EPQ55044.1 beta-lactamase/transpeptidase-like protein [Gloeophyllum trabeum ATCC 11539]
MDVKVPVTAEVYQLDLARRDPTIKLWIYRIALVCLCLRLVWHETAVLQTAIHHWQDRTSVEPQKAKPGVCRAPLPPLLKDHPPKSDAPELSLASALVDASLRDALSELAIDSLVVAVVTAEGSVFEGTYGVLRGNESDAERRGHVDRDSIYRMASISKMFTTIETFILRDKGLLNLDDPVDTFLPNFTYRHTDATHEGPVTIRTLLTHAAGIGGNLPPGNMSDWPHSLDGANTPPYNGRPFPTPERVLEAQAELSLSTPPHGLPLYSNAGFSILGMVNLAAARRSDEYRDRVSTIEELIERDVFEPLGMNSSGYLAADLGAERVAVSSYASEDADYDFQTAMNPTGGQFSTLADLIAPMRMFLNPEKNPSVLSPYTIREWMKPQFSWFDDTTELGMLWEINKYQNSFKDVQRLYQKSGQLMAYHAEFTVNPASGYGVIVLMAGQYLNAQSITFHILDAFQPAFDVLIDQATRELYTGSWTDGEANHVEVSSRDGSLWVDRMVLSGEDVLKLVQGTDEAEPVGLWSTGRSDQFRLAFGESWRNDERGYHCLAYFFGMELGYARGAAINEISFAGEGGARTLYVPSVDVKLRRAA